MSDAPHDENTRDSGPAPASPSPHVAPGLVAVIGEQLRVVGLAIRREATVVAGLVAGISIMTLAYARRAGASLSLSGVDDVAGLAVTAAAIGLLAPMAVWKGEHRFGNSPIWFLPVGHRRHALVKAGAGWVWLMTVMAATLAWLYLTTVVGGGMFGSGESVMVLDAASGARSVVWTTPWWQWMAAFSGATIAYLFATALLLGVRRPIRCLAGILVVVFLYELSTLLLDVSGPGVDRSYLTVEGMLRGIVYGRFGLDTLLTGGTESLETVGRLASGELVIAWRQLPDPGSWATVTLLWNGVGLAALGAAVSRRREGRED